jgi:hypothetical protein
MRVEVCLNGTLWACGLCWLGVLVGRAIKGMEHTVQMLAAYCVLKRCSDAVASPGTMLAPALSSYHLVHESTAPCTPLQRLWGSEAHTHTREYTQACTHTHIHTCTNSRLRMMGFANYLASLATLPHL